MNIRLPLALLAAALIAGCGKKEDAASASASAAAPAAGAKPAASAARVIEITANDAMKFSVTTIDAKVGEEIKIVLTNIGTIPKEAMGHNFVLLKPGTDVNAFSAAAMTAREKDYIPDALKDQIVAHTALLGPRKSDEITFKVTAAGEYPFLCSFPAHAAAGMKGVLVAK